MVRFLRFRNATLQSVVILFYRNEQRPRALVTIYLRFMIFTNIRIGHGHVIFDGRQATGLLQQWQHRRTDRRELLQRRERVLRL